MNPTHCSLKFLLASVLFLVATTVLAESEPQLRRVESFGANPGNLEMFVYRPVGLDDGAPMVLVPHGCFQDVDIVFRHSGWVEVADSFGLVLLFPATNKENEPFGGCFRTWVDGHQARGAGEPQSVRNMIAWALKHESTDPNRVYMSGQSSGGLLTAVMLASYPELFEAGAIQSAYPYRCADAFEDLQPCSQAQKPLDQAAMGELVREASPAFEGRRPRVSIWHGGADALIVPANLDLQLQQWADVLGADTTAVQEEGAVGAQRSVYHDSTGEAVIETVLVESLEHAIAIDPDGRFSCGIEAPYIVDVDVCAAEWIARWFGLAPPPQQLEP